MTFWFDEVAGDSLVLVVLDGSLDDDVLRDAQIQPHVVIDGRELAPVFAEKSGGSLVARRAGDEDADLSIRQRGCAQTAGGVILDDVMHGNPEFLL